MKRGEKKKKKPWAITASHPQRCRQTKDKTNDDGRREYLCNLEMRKDFLN